MWEYIFRDNIYERYKQYNVTDVSTVLEFLNRYYKADRLWNYGGKDYADYVIAQHQKEYKERGYCVISRHESNTGRLVTFYGRDVTQLEFTYYALKFVDGNPKWIGFYELEKAERYMAYGRCFEGEKQTTFINDVEILTAEQMQDAGII